jgi:hypothetical protein
MIARKPKSSSRPLPSLAVEVKSLAGLLRKLAGITKSVAKGLLRFGGLYLNAGSPVLETDDEKRYYRHI